MTLRGREKDHSYEGFLFIQDETSNPGGQQVDIQGGGPIWRDRAWFFVDFWDFEIRREVIGLEERDRVALAHEAVDVPPEPGVSEGKAVFADTNDPDFQAILATFKPIQESLAQTPRMDMIRLGDQMWFQPAAVLLPSTNWSLPPPKAGAGSVRACGRTKSCQL